MQKRAFERISSELESKFFCGNIMYTGTVTDLSENGMFISTSMCFPFNAVFDVLIPLDGGVLKIPVRVSRMVKKDGSYEGMGVEVLGKVSDY